MAEIIPVAFSARWESPVCFVEHRRVKKVRGPAEAIHHMRSEFVEKAGPAYTRAINMCFAALRFEADVDIARTFFLAAYEDHFSNLRR